MYNMSLRKTFELKEGNSIYCIKANSVNFRIILEKHWNWNGEENRKRAFHISHENERWKRIIKENPFCYKGDRKELKAI